MLWAAQSPHFIPATRPLLQALHQFWGPGHPSVQSRGAAKHVLVQRAATSANPTHHPITE